MACIENIPPPNGDSEMEEGEIVDDLDDLSDISSEEEFLLRQRLQVLENYNNVLERKKAKNSTIGAGKTQKPIDLLPQDLSEISASDNEDSFPQITLNKKSINERHKHKKRKQTAVINLGKNRDTKKKSHRVKKKLVPKVVLESSDESDDEYRNKRRKLANAVVVNTPKSDTSSLRARLKKMFGTQSEQTFQDINDTTLKSNTDVQLGLKSNAESIEAMDTLEIEKPLPNEILDTQIKMCELIDLCNDDDVTIINDDNISAQDTVDGIMEKSNGTLSKTTKLSMGDSDEDLELLRQHALKTKANKIKTDELHIEKKPEPPNKPLMASEDEDSDTAELRMICLKSALLKKAIEMKQKQKLRKRLSQSIHEDLIIDDDNLSRQPEAENNTDIESVDMDIGSDGDDKLREISEHGDLVDNVNLFRSDMNIIKDVPIAKSPIKEDADEDEDLLRAKLLTSLSKNWPNLADPAIIDNVTDVPSPEAPAPKVKIKTNVSLEKPFIIKLGDSDSEGEHEATKNLTKMHAKLSEQIDFQHKLDMFLKSTRMEVEKQTLPDVVQQPPDQAKPPPKYIAKTVRHLPKSEQIEYKNLVKRMAELEKIKQMRQTSMNLNKTSVPAKETLKPRNISIDSSNSAINNLEEQIAVSRKKIAEESAKMLKLKEEATKLSQKYKIVATELRNITTAVMFNKKEQRSVQSRLAKIRLQHQTLIKSSTSNKHSKTNLPLVMRNSNKNMSSTKLQKENDPSKEEYKNPLLLKSVKVSVVNDLNEDTVTNTRLSVQVDVSSNKKTVKVPKSPNKERIVDFTKNINRTENLPQEKFLIAEKGGGACGEGPENVIRQCNFDTNNKETNDYISPLEALHSGKCYNRRNCACLHSEYRRFQRFAKGQCVRTSYCDAIWAEDPNSILCPFEVGGSCKDPDCKYLHPKVPSHQ